MPIKAPVAGIAMGLIKEGDDYVVLTDIAGVEDHLGDMDFKVAGTTEGITALQMDIKIKGVTFDILRDALAQANDARQNILGQMKAIIDGPREELSQHAPRIVSLKIDPDKIGLLIGKGGETIRGLQEEFEAQIDVNDEGQVNIYATRGELAEALKDRISGMTKEVELGDEFTGKVVKTTTFGAFVELAKGTDGLIHISNVSPGNRVDTVEEVLSKGDEVRVRVAEVDKERGRIGLRLADDPEIAGKSVDELKALAATSAGGGGGRPAAVTAATAVAVIVTVAAIVVVVVAAVVVRVASIAIPATTTSSHSDPMSQGSAERAGGAGLLAGPVRVTTVAPGVLVATEVLPWARAVALSATIVAGSIDESPEISGAAHLIEHLLFRGSSRFGPGEVDRLFDDLGADLSASTDRCQTQLSTWVMAEHAAAAVDAMSDVIWRPDLREEDVAQEREIVLEELAMIEDAPEELTFELLGDALFPDSPLGRPVIGRRETITALDQHALGAFHRGRYAVAPIVWVGVGAVDHDALCEQVARDLPDWRSSDAAGPTDERRGEPSGAPQRIVVERPSEQVHVAIGVPVFDARGQRRSALQVLDALVGGPPSSRLFQEIRERRGLAYSVSSFLELQQGFGAFGAYVGTGPSGSRSPRRCSPTNCGASPTVTWPTATSPGRAGTSPGARTLHGDRGRAGVPHRRAPLHGAAARRSRRAAAEVASIDHAALTAAAADTLAGLDRAAVACVAPDAEGANRALDAAGLSTAALQR